MKKKRASWGGGVMSQIRVLAIEDDLDALECLGKAVRNEGWEVLLAESGERGLEIFQREKPDIVITDLKMGAVSGLDVLRSIKKTAPLVPVIIITGFGDADTAIAALQYGALDYVKKPIDWDQMLLALGRAGEIVIESKKIIPTPCLLVADDEEEIRKVLSRALQDLEGWQIHIVADGQAAVDVFRRTKVDVVVLDLQMPKKKGLEALAEMRSITKDFEALILTGFGDEGNAIQAIREGAFNFLKKPIDLDVLLVNIQKARERLESTRALRYRIREAELSRSLVAKITEEKQIILNLHKLQSKKVIEFAAALVDALPIGLAVLGPGSDADSGPKVDYMNPQLKRLIGEQGKIDETFVKSLEKIGINISYENLLSEMNSLLDPSGDPLKKVKTGQYSYIAMLRIALMGVNGEQQLALVLGLRGEHRH